MGHYVAIDLPGEVVHALDAWAKREERPRSSLIRLILRRAVAEDQSRDAEDTSTERRAIRNG
jgi:metal-responsive CopG/Arc/MetJ family transcriptional regulator